MTSHAVGAVSRRHFFCSTEVCRNFGGFARFRVVGTAREQARRRHSLAQEGLYCLPFFSALLCSRTEFRVSLPPPPRGCGSTMPHQGGGGGTGGPAEEEAAQSLLSEPDESSSSSSSLLSELLSLSLSLLSSSSSSSSPCFLLLGST